MSDRRSENLERLLRSTDQSERLKTALEAGTYPQPEYIDLLVRRSAIEPDFYVREMLVWALMRHDKSLVVERLLPERQSEIPQARSQALHTFTKIDDKSFYDRIPTQLLFDAVDFVAMTAWRAAARLVPDDKKIELGNILIHQLGRGAFDVQHALSRAFLAIGEEIIGLLDGPSKSDDEKVREHAKFTLAIIADPWSERKLAEAFEMKIEVRTQQETLVGGEGFEPPTSSV